MARFSLCLDLVSFDVPGNWEILALGHTTGGLTKLEDLNIRFIPVAGSYEYPESVRLRDVSRAIREHVGTAEPTGPVAPDAVISWPAQKPVEPFWQRLLFWRLRHHVQYFAIAQILAPDHIRVFSGQLSMPARSRNGPAFEALFPEARAILAQAAFAPERHPFDGVAISADMQSVHAGCFFFRLPREWELSVDEDNDATAFTGEPLNVKIMIATESYPKTEDVQANHLAKELATGVSERLFDGAGVPTVEGGPEDAVSFLVISDKDGDPSTRHLISLRIARHDKTLEVLRVFLSMPEPSAETENGAACIDLVKREVANAVVVENFDSIDP